VSVHDAGGRAGLPVVRGLADERIRVQIDGAEPMAACPNHMNPALSKIAPSKVGSIEVYRGIAPVSVGGDSIGGTIRVESPPPAFADGPGELLATAQGGAYFGSNGNAYGYDATGTVASERLHLSYSESNANADNYEAGRDFKPGGVGSLLPGGDYLDGDVVGSSQYDDLIDRSLTAGVRHEDHLLTVTGALQRVGFEGFPNQRMDMVRNDEARLGIRYAGQYGWGALRASLYGQDVDHEMDFGPDRFDYGLGMPMKARSETRGGSLEGDVRLTERDLLRVGTLYQGYDLDDWWPAVGTVGLMAPDRFWNVRDGERNRFGLFAEWQADWSPRWRTTLGLRGETVLADAGPVQGYNDDFVVWSEDAAAFNARDRRRRDTNVDWAAIVEYAPSDRLSLEAGYARKTRSPSLYELYPWSTNPMAALMNNFVGDGNGYVGDVDLRPEVADTVALTIDLHDDGGGDAWRLEVTGHLTHVDDFIDARRCDFGQCSVENVTRSDGFVILQYANQSARLYGVDVSGHARLWESDRFGSVAATGLLAWVRGDNRKTGDDLHHIMPLHGTVALEHRIGRWSSAAELELVASKTRVSQVRNEVPTDSYSLLHLRASYEWEHVRIDASVENVLDRFYELPLGGAYLGQGPSMSTGTLPWGVTVPGRGRSFQVALRLTF
jgi:iron complex outermembrane receptor protein